MRRIVVTGGAGFLGSHLCRHLPRAGRRSRRGRQPVHRAAREHRRARRPSPGFELVLADVSPRSRCRGAVDGVLHFASPASPPEYLEMPLETMDVGSLGTRNALDLARANDARFLVASTSEIYGDPHVHPQTEDYNGNVDPTGPRAVYDEAKRFAETLTMTYHRLYDAQHRDRAHLQHVRPAPAAGRRSRRVELPRAGGRRQAAHDLRRRLADAFVLLRRRRSARPRSRCSTPTSSIR